MNKALIGLKASGALMLAVALSHLAAGNLFWAALSLGAVLWTIAVVYRQEGWNGRNRRFYDTPPVYEITLEDLENMEGRDGIRQLPAQKP